MRDGPVDPLAAARTPVWRRALPFVIAAALVAFVLSRLDLRAFAAHLARVNYPAFVGFAVVFVLALLTADAFGTAVVYRWTIARVAFRDLWVIRGASYLPSLLNHHVGQAFLTWFLSRAHAVPLGRVAGATLLVYASWTGCLLLLAAAGLLATGKPAAWLILPLGAGVVYLVVIAIAPRALARMRLLAPLFEAGVRGHVIALCARLPHLVVLFLGTWLPFWFFGVHIPVSSALALTPLLMVATTLPLTPQGFGTRDVLAAELFEQFAIGSSAAERLAAIAAATASWGIAITLVEAVIGLLLMRLALPKLDSPTSTPGESALQRETVGR
jgi:hypothetical protein